MSFAGGDPFNVTGTPIDKDTALIDLGLNLGITDSVTLGVNYGGQFGKRATDHGVQAGISVKF
jgi:outer membrane autotransporter protein